MAGLIRKLFSLLPPRLKWAGAGIAAFMVVSALLELAGLALLMPAVSVFADPSLLETNRLLARLYAFSPAETPNGFVLFCAAALVIFYLVKNLLGIVMVRCQSRFSMSISNLTAERLFRRYVSAPYREYANFSSAELTARLSRVYDFTRELILPMLFAASEICVFAVIAAMTAAVDWKIASFAALAAGLALFFFYFPLKRKMEKCGRIDQKAAEGIFSLLAQVFGSIELIRTTRTEEAFAERFDAVQKQRALAQKQSSDIGQMPRFAMEFFGVLLAMGVLAMLVLSGRPLAGIAAAGAFFAAALIRLMPGVSRIHYNLLHIRYGKYLFEEICRDIESFPHEDLPETGAPELTFHRELSFENLHFSYGEGQKDIFGGFSLTLKRSESVLITGPTGCGKSTFIHIAAGLIQPDSGTVRADGRDIRENLRSWRAKIGFVPQDIFLLDASIRENVAFGVPPEEIDDRKAEECLAAAQILDFVRALPEGLSARTGEGGAKLSGGQRQRIAIARALYRDPELLILDEATSALDEETESALVDALGALRGRTAVLMIAHHFRNDGHFDRVISLDGRS